jgi:hypothetical protein
MTLRRLCFAAAVLIGFGTLASGASAAPITSEPLAPDTLALVDYAKGGKHGWKGGRGHHHGWHRGRGRHYGWHRGRHHGWHKRGRHHGYGHARRAYRF